MASTLDKIQIPIIKQQNTKNIYFVPFSQDDPNKKPHSLVADFELIPYCIEKALRKEQEQPIIK